MVRGGYFAGNHWSPYTSGNLSHSTATSVQEIKKQNSVKCPKCNNKVPLKESCIFCGSDLTDIVVENQVNILKKHCPICNKAQDIDNSHCINCNYAFNVSNIDKLKNTNKIKPKKPLFNSKFSDDDLFQLFRVNFTKSDFVKWDIEFIPKNQNSKLERFYDDNLSICFSRLVIGENESIYYFADKKERFPKLMLFFNSNTIKSNFKLYKNEVLLMLRLSKNVNEINKTFKLRYASKNKKSKLYYLSLGDLKEDNIFENLQVLINSYCDCIINPLLGNYEYNGKLDLSDFLD